MKKYVLALCVAFMPFGLQASDQINKLKKSWQIINYNENSGFDGSGINLGIIDMYLIAKTRIEVSRARIMCLSIMTLIWGEIIEIVCGTAHM